MRRFAIFLVAMVLMMTCISCVNAEKSKKYIVNTEETPLNVRNFNDTSIKEGSVPKGAIVDVVGNDKFWSYIYYDGALTKIFSTYLVEADSSTKSTSTSSTTRKTRKFKVEPASIDEASMVFVVSDSVNNNIPVRAGKAMNANTIGNLYPGDEVYVIKNGRYWSRVVFNGLKGFVKSKYIHFLKTNLPESGELYKVNVGTNETLRVRQEPKKDGEIITKIFDDALIKVIEPAGENDEWSLIYYNMYDQGYVMNKFIQAVND